MTASETKVLACVVPGGYERTCSYCENAREQYYQLRGEVHARAEELAKETGHDSRTISLWLVIDKGFPWRHDCDFDDLIKMKEFLASQNAYDEASGIHPAEKPRWQRELEKRRGTLD